MDEKSSIANVGSRQYGALSRMLASHPITSEPGKTSDRDICVVSTTNAHARRVSGQFAILGPQRTKKRLRSERWGLYESLGR